MSFHLRGLKERAVDRALPAVKTVALVPHTPMYERKKQVIGNELLRKSTTVQHINEETAEEFVPYAALELTAATGPVQELVRDVSYAVDLITGFDIGWFADTIANAPDIYWADIFGRRGGGIGVGKRPFWLPKVRTLQAQGRIIDGLKGSFVLSSDVRLLEQNVMAAVLLDLKNNGGQQLDALLERIPTRRERRRIKRQLKGIEKSRALEQKITQLAQEHPDISPRELAKHLSFWEAIQFRRTSIQREDKLFLRKEKAKEQTVTGHTVRRRKTVNNEITTALRAEIQEGNVESEQLERVITSEIARVDTYSDPKLRRQELDFRRDAVIYVTRNQTIEAAKRIGVRSFPILTKLLKIVTGFGLGLLSETGVVGVLLANNARSTGFSVWRERLKAANEEKLLRFFSKPETFETEPHVEERIRRALLGNPEPQTNIPTIDTPVTS